MEATAGVLRAMELLSAQKQPNEAAAWLARYLLVTPGMMIEARQRTSYTTERGALYDAVVSELSGAGQKEAALGWAKLRLMLCEFS